MKDTAYRSTGMRTRGLPTRVLGVAWLATALACGGSGNGQNQQQQQAEGVRLDTTLHKIQVSADKAQALEQQGATVVADYGSYKLLQVSSNHLAVLSADVGAELRDDYNQILLNAGAIDTASTHAQSQRGVRKSAVGNSLHMVQFAGPVRPEWYQALEATGVRIVTYVPNNAYIVYGNSESLQRLQQHVTARPSVIQWDGEFLNDYKLAPSVNTVRADGYSIQLVKDDENRGTLELIQGLQTRKPFITEALGYVNVEAFVSREALNTIIQRPDVLSVHARVETKKFDERQNLIHAGLITGNSPTPGTNYLTWLASKGFTQAQIGRAHV